MFNRGYSEEFLAETTLDEKVFIDIRWKFFSKMEQGIANPHVTKYTAETFRRRYGLPEKFGFPYWEIHWFEEGFSSLSAGDDWLPLGKQTHIYYTLRGLVDDEILLSALSPKSVFKSEKFTLYKNLQTTKRHSKIDEYYRKEQDHYGIDLYVFDDVITTPKVYDLLYTDVTITHVNEVVSCFNKTDETIDVALKDLPMVMILSGNSKFLSKAKNPAETIVLLDKHTILSHEPGIEGNLYLHEDSIFYPLLSVSDESDHIHIGKNIVIGRRSDVSSSYVGDNVLIGKNVKAERDSKIRTGCLISPGTKISKSQEIPAGQIITSGQSLITQYVEKRTEIMFEEATKEIMKIIKG